MVIAIVSALRNGPLTISHLIECMTPHIRTNKKWNLFLDHVHMNYRILNVWSNIIHMGDGY